MMNKEQFFSFMKYSVQDLVTERGIEGKIELENVMKNNDQALTGLVIRENGSDMSPCIYLDDMYERYQDGYPLDEMANEIADMIEDIENPDISIEQLVDYDYMKSHLSIRVVGIDENEQWLADKVWEQMGDFAKVCYFDLGEQSGGRMSSVVTMRNMALMGVTSEQMMADAQKNLNNKDHVFMNISAVIAELVGEIQEAAPMEFGGPPMYVLTNEERMQGAALIARPDVMKEIGEKMGCDYYVLPSSIHEVLIVPVDAGIEVEQLSEMVQEVNATEVRREDKLSDKVQYYDREREQLRNALDPVATEPAKVPKEKTQER